MNGMLIFLSITVINVMWIDSSTAVIEAKLTYYSSTAVNYTILILSLLIQHSFDMFVNIFIQCYL